MKNFFQAVVVDCEEQKIGTGIFYLTLKFDDSVDFQASPGQFVILEPLDQRSVMPRPFSIVQVVDNFVLLIFKTVGSNTRLYAQLKEGDRIKVFGPRGAKISTDVETDVCFLVGGGVGSVALVMLAEQLVEQGKHVVVFLGAKRMKEVVGFNLLLNLFVDIEVVVEQGEHEQIGMVTDYLTTALDDVSGEVTVFSCGPKPMLRKVAEISKRHNSRCVVLLEELMACGMGACKGCAVFGVDGSHKHVCSDGPAFDAEWIDWDKFAPKSCAQIVDRLAPSEIDMSISFCGLQLDHPTMNSSGCLSLEAIKEGDIDISCLGALVTKGVTVSPLAGNAMPRTCETSSGMINSIGLENRGIVSFIKDELPGWLAYGKPVIVNISGFSIDDFEFLAKKLDDTEIAGIEVNISCPNVKHGGAAFGIDSALAYAVTKRVREVTNKVVIVKLTPNVSDIKDIAKSVMMGGADAISLVNTFLAMAIDPWTRKPRIGAVMGGLSGSAIHPIAVRMVYQVFQADLDVPIIGMGGIVDAESAAEFIVAGANVVAMGTGGFGNRQLFTEVDQGLREIISYNGFTAVGGLTGALRS